MYWLFGDIDNIEGKFYDFNHKETTFKDSGFISFDFVNEVWAVSITRQRC